MEVDVKKNFWVVSIKACVLCCIKNGPSTRYAEGGSRCEMIMRPPLLQASSSFFTPTLAATAVTDTLTYFIFTTGTFAARILPLAETDTIYISYGVMESSSTASS